VSELKNQNAENDFKKRYSVLLPKISATLKLPKKWVFKAEYMSNLSLIKTVLSQALEHGAQIRIWRKKPIVLLVSSLP
jgi:hypothetical protein